MKRGAGTREKNKPHTPSQKNSDLKKNGGGGDSMVGFLLILKICIIYCIESQNRLTKSKQRERSNETI